MKRNTLLTGIMIVVIICGSIFILKSKVSSHKGDLFLSKEESVVLAKEAKNIENEELRINKMADSLGIKLKTKNEFQSTDAQKVAKYLFTALVQRDPSYFQRPFHEAVVEEDKFANDITDKKKLLKYGMNKINRRGKLKQINLISDQEEEQYIRMMNFLLIYEDNVEISMEIQLQRLVDAQHEGEYAIVTSMWEMAGIVNGAPINLNDIGLK